MSADSCTVKDMPSQIRHYSVQFVSRPSPLAAPCGMYHSMRLEVQDCHASTCPPCLQLQQGMWF